MLSIRKLSLTSFSQAAVKKFNCKTDGKDKVNALGLYGTFKASFELDTAKGTLEVNDLAVKILESNERSVKIFTERRISYSARKSEKMVKAKPNYSWAPCATTLTQSLISIANNLKES